jgi:cytoskeletal protein RodZ
VFEIGNSLRDARVRKGLELAQLEAETKIRARYLRALEEEQFDALPGDSYVKGFLRTYAERLGLDGQLYVDEYNSRFSLAEEPVVASRDKGRARRARAESHAVIVALVGILAVTVLVIAAWKFGATGDEEEPPPPPAAPSVSTPAPPASATTGPGGTSATEAPVDLSVTAVGGPSRIEVHRGSALGEFVWEGTLEEGESQVFQGVELWLQVSRPGNLEFLLNGSPVSDFTGKKPVVLVASAEGLERAPSP